MVAMVQFKPFNDGAVRRCKVFSAIFASRTKEYRPTDLGARVTNCGRLAHRVHHVIHDTPPSAMSSFLVGAEDRTVLGQDGVPHCQF